MKQSSHALNSFQPAQPARLIAIAYQRLSYLGNNPSSTTSAELLPDGSDDERLHLRPHRKLEA